jgi:hypothetical protein
MISECVNMWFILGNLSSLVKNFLELNSYIREVSLMVEFSHYDKPMGEIFLCQ